MSGLLQHCVAGDWPERPGGRFAARIIDLHADPDALEAHTATPLLAGGRHWRGIGLLGLADDAGVRLNGGRTGARDGPDAFRAALCRYGGAGSVALADLQVPVCDLGNIAPGEDLDDTHRRVSETVTAMIAAGLMPTGIGGGHDLTFAEVRAVIDQVARPGPGEIHGVYFDAHLDVREEAGSGMPFRRLIEYGGIESLSLFGFDPLSNTPEHRQWFIDHGGRFADWPAHQWPGADCQFASICLDAIDMSQAPGVSAPAPAGLQAATVADYAEAAGRQPGVCCFDIMELCPAHDEGGRTARLAAHFYLRFLTGIARRPAPGAGSWPE